MQEITPPLNFSCNRMYVYWREREHKEVDMFVDEDPAAITTLNDFQARKNDKRVPKSGKKGKKVYK